MNLTRGKIIAIGSMVALGAVLALLPQKNTVSSAEVIELTANQKIEEAVKIITQGAGAPMQGIKLLKEVLEENPNNEQALYYLGNFSIQSGQFDKAVIRFEALLKVDAENEEARYLLAHSQQMLGDTSAALKNYQIVLESTVNSELKELVEKEINNIKNI
ncbi:MAG: tetratricopeptide repeat protein [Salibacteraceae bacterium]